MWAFSPLIFPTISPLVEDLSLICICPSTSWISYLWIVSALFLFFFSFFLYPFFPLLIISPENMEFMCCRWSYFLVSFFFCLCPWLLQLLTHYFNTFAVLLYIHSLFLGVWFCLVLGFFLFFSSLLYLLTPSFFIVFSYPLARLLSFFFIE